MHADSDISSDVFGQSLRTFSIESLTATQEKWHQERTYVLLWIYQGSGRQYIDDQVYEIQEDQVWFVGPSQIHRWETKGIQGLKMTFSLDFMCATGISDQFIERLQLFGQHPPFAQVNAKAAARLKQLTDWWEEEENDPSTQQGEVISGLLKLILLVCQSLSQSNADLAETDSLLTHQFKDLVEKHYQQWHKVKEYADALAITPNHLNDQVKSDLNISAKAFIQERIILEAKRFAHFSDKNLKQTAYQLGFHDSSHFGKFFKQSVGMSFSAFRASMKE